MEIDARAIEDVLLIKVEGRIDFSNTREFEDPLLAAIAGIPQGAGKALLDLGGVTYMSSSGLRVLMLASKQIQARESEIVVAALRPVLREVFKISRFDKVFRVYETVEEALRELSPGAASAFAAEQGV